MPAGKKPEHAVYIYGIVPSDVETTLDARGVGSPPAKVRTVARGDIAALVSLVDTKKPLGRPEDLTAHEALLDQTAAEAPVLPVRFGAVMTDEEAVVEELLSAHYEEFVTALEELEGKAEFVVRGRYELDAVLREMLAADEEVVRLRDAIRDKPEDATRNERMALGERIANAIAARREVDTQTVVQALTDVGGTVNVREPTHDEDAAHVACLIDLSAQHDLESAVDKIAREWVDRVNVRLLGPLAPYDFVVKTEV
ncbi:GvpL/GvpF family gas vesicle protein [Actinophytocola sp.]|uniref:GvpL/GvpF family gas vesicle protein n=1 Tax=Actinophytocola sp. TaxID=1872138 RepID=UPI002ED31FAB